MLPDNLTRLASPEFLRGARPWAYSRDILSVGFRKRCKHSTRDPLRLIHQAFDDTRTMEAHVLFFSATGLRGLGLDGARVPLPDWRGKSKAHSRSPAPTPGSVAAWHRSDESASQIRPGCLLRAPIHGRLYISKCRLPSSGSANEGPHPGQVTPVCRGSTSRGQQARDRIP